MITRYLNKLKSQLGNLESGQSCRVHELTVLEAKNEYYQKWNAEHWPSTSGAQNDDPLTLDDWCTKNGFVIRDEIGTDYIIFHRGNTAHGIVVLGA